MISDSIITILCVVPAIYIYFLPGMLATSRSHRDNMAIFALNLFTGWTILGWLLSLVWALTGNVEKEEKKEPVAKKHYFDGLF